MSNELKEKLKEAFLSIDVSQDGSIDWEELQICCKNIELKLDESDQQDFQKYSQCPVNYSRETGTSRIKEGLDFVQFSDFVRNRLRKTFNAVDTNGNGFIDHEEIVQVLEKTGIKVSSRKIDAILKAMDIDGDQRISFDEFCTFALKGKD